jgi:hypothetical protein
MKKNILRFLVVSTILLYSSSAWAFVLPPFKLDIVNTAKEIGTYFKTTAKTVQKKIQESSIIQTTITYGKGAKEAYDFSKKTIKDYKSFDLNKLGSIANDIKKAQAKKSKTSEEAEKEILASKKETDKKIEEIQKNQLELDKKILNDPQNALKYQKQKDKNTQKINKLLADQEKKVNKIRKKAKKENDNTEKQISDMKGQVGNILDSTISDDYDSTDDLKGTAEVLLPSDDVEVNVAMADAYKAAYRVLHYGDIGKALYRSVLVRTKMAENNEKTKEKLKAETELEGYVAAASISTQIKADNMQALLNFTELFLHRIQISISNDLRLGKFEKISNARAVSDFNFDNYRFIMLDDDAYESDEEKKEKPETVPLPGIIEGSKDIFAGGEDSMKMGAQMTLPKDETSEAVENSGGVNNEEK